MRGMWRLHLHFSGITHPAQSAKSRIVSTSTGKLTLVRRLIRESILECVDV